MRNKTALQRRELLKIDGRLVEMKIKLNPRASRPLIKVHPTNGEVCVVAPSLKALEHAIRFARGESAWIARQLSRIPAPIALKPGERIPFRGEDHMIVQTEGRATARHDEAAHLIRVGGHPEHAPRRIVDFLKREARRAIEARVLDYAERLDVHPRRITLRDTKSRWGSCSAGRHLSFSWRLILAPSFVLDYVAAHETAHLRELNHKPAFWSLVGTLIDDIETPQDWLRRNGASLHRYASGPTRENGEGA